MKIDLERYRGDLEKPGTWTGLSQTDRIILDAHRQTTLRNVTDAWFNVPLPDTSANALAQHCEKDLQPIVCAWFRRVDLITRDPNGYQLIEIKPSAAYVALGQLLAYAHLIPLTQPQLAPLALRVLTDAHDPALTQLFKAHRIDVVDLPNTQYSPPSRPT